MKARINKIEADNDIMQLNLAKVKKQTTQIKEEKIIKQEPVKRVVKQETTSKNVEEVPKTTRKVATTKTTTVNSKTVQEPKETPNIGRRARRGKTQILGLFDNDGDIY